jgi:pyruvate/2-oxoglutarate dehydrogenase complex dihydrolipoamide acyltransferase (E2) component
MRCATSESIDKEDGMLRQINVQPGKEDDLRHVLGWLAVSERVDRLIEATEAPCETEPAPARASVQNPVTERAKPPSPRRQPVLGSLARRAGRTLRRIGEGLEAWGSAPRLRPSRARPERPRGHGP